MMPNTFLTSDTHYGHYGITQFLNYDGTKTRPWDNIEEMDEALVANWNSVVRPGDKIYHLGDVAMNNKALPIMERLNGTKVLIKGNHDIHKPNTYLKYFKDIRGYHVLDRCLLSHIPVHPDSKARFVRQFHGHLHHGRVKFPNGKIDPWYQNVCVETTNYFPISFDDAKKRALKEAEMLDSQKDFIYNMGM